MGRYTKRERAMYIASLILAAENKEYADYKDIILGGGNPFEYGMRSTRQVIADVVMRYLPDASPHARKPKKSVDTPAGAG